MEQAVQNLQPTQQMLALVVLSEALATARHPQTSKTQFQMSAQWIAECSKKRIH